MYDDFGNVIDNDILKYSNIQWIVPKYDTMLVVPDTYQGIDSLDGTKIIYQST